MRITKVTIFLSGTDVSFNWNYNVCSHFAMIKLELFKLKGVDDVAVAISANVNNFFGLFTTHYFTNFSPVLISIWKGKRSDQKKCVVTSFDWNYNECSHFAMIKLKLF